MKVKMVMRMVMFTVMMVLFGGAVMAKEPKGCKIYSLRGTSHGESWTPSVPIKSLVTVALKNPNPEPWRQIDFEFESSSGANVGTLELVRKDPILNLTLNSWATTVHSYRGRTQAFQNKGSFKKLMNLNDWVYLNVSAAEKVKLTVNTSSVVFHRVNPKGFKSLYVRVPAGQDLDVGFNCGQANTKMAPPAGTDGLSEEEGTKPSKMIVIVGILVALLICGVVVYWCLGRKKRNALIEKLKQDEEALLESGFENASSSRRESAKREKVVEVGEDQGMLQDVDKCVDCGDEIVDETVDRCDDCGDEIHEEEKSRDVDRDEEKPRDVDRDEEKLRDVDRDKEKPRDVDRDEEKPRYVDMDEEKPGDVDRDEKSRDVDRDEEKPRDVDRDEEKPRDVDRDEEKSRDVDMDEEKPRDVDRDEEKPRDMDRDEEKPRDVDRDEEKSRDVDTDEEKPRDVNKDEEKQEGKDEDVHENEGDCSCSDEEHE